VNFRTFAAGNVLVAGEFQNTVNFGGGSLTSAGGRDIFIAKYTANGDYLWARRFGYAYDDSANSIAADANGNVIVTGYFSDRVDFGGGTIWAALGGIDAFLAKFTPDGNFDSTNPDPTQRSWAKNFGSNSEDRGTGVAVDANGNIVLGGYFQGSLDLGGGYLNSQGGGKDIFIAKFSSSGTYTWSKSYGGGYGDQAVGLAVDRSGDVFVTGWYLYSTDLGGGPLLASQYAAFLAKYSGNDGHHLWSKSFSGAGYIFGNAVTVDANGNAAITGNFTSTIDLGGGVLNTSAFGVTTIFVAKYSSAGGHLWSKRFGGTSYADSTAIATDGTGHVLVTGPFMGTADFGVQSLSSTGSDDMYLLRLDP